MLLADLLTAITSTFATILAIAGDTIDFMVSQPIILLGVAVSFGGVFVGFARKMLGR